MWIFANTLDNIFTLVQTLQWHGWRKHSSYIIYITSIATLTTDLFCILCLKSWSECMSALLYLELLFSLLTYSEIHAIIFIHIYAHAHIYTSTSYPLNREQVSMWKQYNWSHEDFSVIGVAKASFLVTQLRNGFPMVLTRFEHSLMPLVGWVIEKQHGLCQAAKQQLALQEGRNLSTLKGAQTCCGTPVIGTATQFLVFLWVNIWEKLKGGVPCKLSSSCTPRRLGHALVLQALCVASRLCSELTCQFFLSLGSSSGITQKCEDSPLS